MRAQDPAFSKAEWNYNSLAASVLHVSHYYCVVFQTVHLNAVSDLCPAVSVPFSTLTEYLLVSNKNTVWMVTERSTGCSEQS